MTGSGTSMVTMYVPCKRDSMNKANKKLSDEAGSAANIKSTVNKNQVLNAITAISEKLKLYKEIPKNGLVIFCGQVDQDSGKKFTMDLVPFKPITFFDYHCDSKFKLEPLQQMLISEKKFGFVIIDGNGTLWATL